MYNSFGGYVKSGFKLISKNPILFIPKIISILYTIVIAGIFIFACKYSYDFELLLHQNVTVVVIICFLLWILIEIFLEAGQLNMIKKSILKEEVYFKDFIGGIRKYSGRFIGGNLILTFILIVVLLLFTQILFSSSEQYFFNALVNNNISSINQINKNSYYISVIVLILIFIVPLIILSFFISFWKTILVYEDCKLTESFKLSFKFVKRNFWISVIYQFTAGLINNFNRPRNNKENEFFPDYYKLFLLEPTVIITAVAAFTLKQFLMLYIEVIYFKTYDDRRNIAVIDNEFLE